MKIAVSRSIFGLFTLMATAAQAEDADVKQTYYSADSWAVTMHEDGFKNVKPNSCAIQSTLWTNKEVVFGLINKDDITSFYGLFIAKKDWNLPLTTPPKVASITISSSNNSREVKFFSSKMDMTVASEEALSSFFQTNATFGPMDGASLLNAMFFRTMPKTQQAEELEKKPELANAVSLVNFTEAFESVFNAEGDPAGIAISFGGNEPVWSIPPLSRYEAAQINFAVKTCIADMTRLNSSENTPSKTSPLGSEN
ncbi:hypothetical protein [Rhizobium tumorigenes]|uniref:Uncharacterized protein n=1 Tax=Rhizobium tumorigenes TaxID=2041385 RepID=A0AAF1KQH2_9HYPH|nr:hypothetical protein [Rhizobium tumorigenes]WFR95712.1 hypothetical protein PR017_00740 [Rhizobium tumorigenes]